MIEDSTSAMFGQQKRPDTTPMRTKKPKASRFTTISTSRQLARHRWATRAFLTAGATASGVAAVLGLSTTCAHADSDSGQAVHCVAMDASATQLGGISTDTTRVVNSCGFEVHFSYCVESSNGGGAVSCKTGVFGAGSLGANRSTLVSIMGANTPFEVYLATCRDPYYPDTKWPGGNHPYACWSPGGGASNDAPQGSTSSASLSSAGTSDNTNRAIADALASLSTAKSGTLPPPGGSIAPQSPTLGAITQSSSTEVLSQGINTVKSLPAPVQSQLQGQLQLMHQDCLAVAANPSSCPSVSGATVAGSAASIQSAAAEQAARQVAIAAAQQRAADLTNQVNQMRAASNAATMATGASFLMGLMQSASESPEDDSTGVEAEGLEEERQAALAEVQRQQQAAAAAAQERAQREKGAQERARREQYDALIAPGAPPAANPFDAHAASKPPGRDDANPFPQH
jgi:hypothetical protein